jgi:hypothetical protein
VFPIFTLVTPFHSMGLEVKYAIGWNNMPEDDEEMESDADLKNDEWFKENYLDLMQEHPHQWIAVMDQRIIAVSSNEAGAENIAREIVGDKDFSLYYVAPTAIETDVTYAKK